MSDENEDGGKVCRRREGRLGDEGEDDPRYSKQQSLCHYIMIVIFRPFVMLYNLYITRDDPRDSRSRCGHGEWDGECEDGVALIITK